METSFKYRWFKSGDHIHVSVFAGPDKNHRAHSGNLILLQKEWDDFRGELNCEVEVEEREPSVG